MHKKSNGLFWYGLFSNCICFAFRLTQYLFLTLISQSQISNVQMNSYAEYLLCTFHEYWRPRREKGEQKWEHTTMKWIIICLFNGKIMNFQGSQNAFPSDGLVSVCRFSWASVLMFSIHAEIFFGIWPRKQQYNEEEIRFIKSISAYFTFWKLIAEYRLSWSKPNQNQRQQ